MSPEHEDPGSMEPQTVEIEAVMQEFEAPLLRYATRILNDRNAAQDVVQDTFIKYYKACSNGTRPDRQVSSWLYRVAHNAAVDYIRKESRLRVLHEKQAEEVKVASTRSDQALNKEEAMALALEQLDSLEERDRQVVILRLQEGRSYKEIAEITGLSDGNVGYILHHAVKKLAERMKRLGAI